MATAKLKIRNGNAWEQIHPETNLDAIIDMTTGGRNIAKLANPGSAGLVRLNTDGTAQIVPLAQVRTDIGAAATNHSHIESEITGLTAALNKKADLVGGKIISTQIPDWMIGGLKYIDQITSATKTVDGTFRSTYGMTDDATSKGRYVVINVATCTITLGANHILMVGDEGATTGSIVLERGDWIVYRGKNGSNYEFDIVNNEYQQATTSVTGVVQLSNGSITTRGGLASSSSGTKVIDEYALRQVLKGIYYGANEASVSNPLQNDILFEITGS